MKRLAAHRDAGRFQRLDLAQQRRRVDHQAVADHGLLPGTQNAARDQLEDELLLADENRVAGIVAALIARHDIEPFREEIDDLAFALVAPLGAEDDYVSHFDQTYLVYRTRRRNKRETEKRTPSSLEARRSVIRLHFMQISEVYLGLGQDAFAQLIRGISIGKLKIYQIYEGFKVRAHLTKVNTESLRKAVPKLWERISARGRGFRQRPGAGHPGFPPGHDLGRAGFPGRAA